MRGIKEIRARLKIFEAKQEQLEYTRTKSMVDGIEAHIVRDKINLLKWVLKERENNYPEQRI